MPWLLAGHELPHSSAQLDDDAVLGVKTSARGVRRDKAALSSGCEGHPANAPAGSNEVAEAFG